MANQAQEVFRKIVLYNKLLSDAEVDALLAECPEPEKAVQRLVQLKKIAPAVSGQILGIYRKQMAQYAGQRAAAPAAEAQSVNVWVSEDKPSAAPVAAPAAAPAPAPEAETTRELILKLLRAARAASASDLHIMSGAVPVGRIAGTLRDLKMPPIPPDMCERALLSILRPDQGKLFREHLDLDFCYDAGPELGRFRVNFLRHRRGIDGIFRVIPTKVPSMAELNLPEVVRRLTDYRQGLVLVTGPKGCGKTTTLAAMIDLINSTRQEHIISIEDPIEFIHPCKLSHVNQREVGTHTDSFSNALRAALREAPDVIVVGEMRDLETTQLAITAAETGHLVLATLHTPNAVRTIGRVLDVFPPREQGQIREMISESLRGIVSQQLVPSRDGRSLYLAVEVLLNTTAVGNLISEGRTFQLRGVIQTGKKLGMVLMDETLVRLAKEGKIAKAEALARAEEPSLVRRELES